ncbi:hypothetical protein N7488_000548 [Penicillium malachiteum]|nr:hypothetical protein N7488_000548 [Penicillium malachiteum]
MRIIDPQSAVLTNIEVLAYLTSNPPRRSPNPPSNADRLWVPSPDLRDHNTVVKEVRLATLQLNPPPKIMDRDRPGSSRIHPREERGKKAHCYTSYLGCIWNEKLTLRFRSIQIHNYVTRISPHLLKYPRSTPRPSSSQSASAAAMMGTMRPAAESSDIDNNDPSKPSIPPPVIASEQTPMDHALRELITKLQPYGLTKAEVVMILNLGVGASSPADGQNGEEFNGNGDAMEVDENGANGEEEEAEEDFGALALFESVVEEREARISDEDVQVVLGIIREVLSQNYE